MSSTELFIGLISGTSVDAIDAVLVDFSGPQPQLLAQRAHPFEPELREQVCALMLPGDNEIDRLGVVDWELGRAFAEAANKIIEDSGAERSRIAAIGSHGQTVRHRPPGHLARAFTLQLADPNLIAEYTGITTVADMRRRDMAAGGQGAPMVPAFHRAVFRSEAVNRAVVNVGGISNVTWLPADGEVLGFDTGTGNGLMDAWIHRHRQQSYDRDGEWAASGTADAALLEDLLAHPYFAAPIPKSTGREEFNLPWLESVLARHPAVTPVDVQATLLELTARCIADHLARLGSTEPMEIYLCGGGAHNRALLRRLEALTHSPVASTDALGLPPDWIEAMAFAWLAKQTLAHQPGNLPAVTGADREVILGGVYYSGE